MTIFEITTIILLPIALTMAYAFKKHNEELLEKERRTEKVCKRKLDVSERVMMNEKGILQCEVY